MSCDLSILKWDLPKLASVETSEVSQILGTSAQCGGLVVSDGGLDIIERGVCYSTTQNPTTTGQKILCGTGLGSFTTTINDLTMKTTYFVRAYATTKVGTSYGTETTFTTAGLASITTNVITSISSTSAIGGGNITSSGGLPVTQRGICWSISRNPTTSDSRIYSGSGLGQFSISFSGLLSNTTYYVRAFAINNAGTSYGNEVSFITASLPILTTLPANLITQTTAQCGGLITSAGSSNVTVRGIAYGTTPNPTTSNNYITGGSGTGSFLATITGLTSSTTYYIRAFASNSFGTSYGNEISFKTLSATLPTISTSPINSISVYSAISGGNVTSDGGSPVSQRGICYSTSSNPSTANSKILSGAGIGSFSSTLTGLNPNTTYYVRAYAVNNYGTAYGEVLSFNTIPALILGQNYQGGVIFYLNTAKDHGLICAPTDQSSGAIWGCSGTSIINSTGTSVGTGQANTSAIISGCATAGIAARICNDLILGGYTDWYLPSLSELGLVYSNLAAKGLGNFQSTYYWSSSQYSSTSSYLQSFSNGGTYTTTKSSAFRVRAIRVF